MGAAAGHNCTNYIASHWGINAKATIPGGVIEDPTPVS